MSSMGSKDMMMMGGLILGLFLIAVLVGVSYLGFGELKETICENEVSGYDYANGVCYNQTIGTANATAVTITAITKVSIVEAVIDTVLGLLALVALMLIFKVVIKVAKGFSSAN